MRTKTWSLLASLAQPLSVFSSCCSWGSRLASSFGACSKSWEWDQVWSEQLKEHCKVPLRADQLHVPCRAVVGSWASTKTLCRASQYTETLCELCKGLIPSCWIWHTESPGGGAAHGFPVSLGSLSRTCSQIAVSNGGISTLGLLHLSSSHLHQD